MKISTIKAPEGVKYLSDVLPEKALPRNCIFNKVLTGCGGTYLALTDPEPYIIAVPTRSLVKDKVLNPQYKHLNVQGVSEDYPIGKRPLNLHDKIVVTYKSLPRVAKLVDICSYNHPDWFEIIDKVGVDVCKAKGYQKAKIKPIYDAMLKAGDADLIQRIHRAFFIGDVYSSKDIKEKLIALGAPNPTGSAISRWFEVKKTVKNGVSAYRILHRRDTFL